MWPASGGSGDGRARARSGTRIGPPLTAMPLGPHGSTGGGWLLTCVPTVGATTWGIRPGELP